MHLHFKELGQGEPLVILHGLFGSSDNWLGVAPKLAHDFHVYLLDLRNHGLSPHSDEMDFSLMAGDVAEFLDAHKLDRVNLLGHSLGGKVAMQFALTFPDRLKTVIVVDMAPRAYAPEHNTIFKALLALDLKQFQSRRQIEDTLAPAIPDLTVRRFLLKNLQTDPDTRAFSWRIPLDTLYANYPKLCEAIETSDRHARVFEKPTLFLHGGKSPYVTDADAPQIQKLFPMSKIEAIAKANHWVHAEAPDEFVQRVSEFLGR